MALVPVDFFVFQSFLTWAQQWFQTMENCDGKSMKQQLLLWGFQVDGIAWSTTVCSKASSSQSTRDRAEIPKIRHRAAKGILCLEAAAALTKLKR